MQSNRPQTYSEELANTAIHGVGAVLGFVGLLLSARYVQVSPDDAAAFAVYALSVTVLFGISAVYHLVPHGKAKRVLQRGDHCAIYGLIAGTYTPISLVGLGGTSGLRLCIAVWVLAAIGILLELAVEERMERVSLAFYLMMGWLGIFVAVPLFKALSITVLGLLFFGGVLYTGGIWFYVRDKPWDHALWHGFVLGGAAAHGLAVGLTA